MLSSLIQHRAGHMGYADHLNVSGMWCVSSCTSGISLPKCYVPTRMFSSAFQDFEQPSRVQVVCLSSGEIMWMHV